jgi:hypothetical protein
MATSCDPEADAGRTPVRSERGSWARLSPAGLTRTARGGLLDAAWSPDGLRIDPRVLVILLVFGAATGFLNVLNVTLPILLIEHLGIGVSQIGLYETVMGLAGIGIYPAALFVVLVLVGRQLDLGTNAMGIFLSAALGALAGHYAGGAAGVAFTALFFGPSYVGMSTYYFLTWPAGAFTMALVAFGTISLAYLSLSRGPEFKNH